MDSGSDQMDERSALLGHERSSDGVPTSVEDECQVAEDGEKSKSQWYLFTLTIGLGGYGNRVHYCTRKRLSDAEPVCSVPGLLK